MVGALVPLLVVVDHVEGLWGEVFSDLLVGEHGVEKLDFVDGWFMTLVTDSSHCEKSEEEEMHLPEEGLVCHEEAECCVAYETSSPAVI